MLSEAAASYYLINFLSKPKLSLLFTVEKDREGLAMDVNKDRVRVEFVDFAVDKSTRESQLLANFYLRHGHDREALQLLRVIREIGDKQKDGRQKRGKSA